MAYSNSKIKPYKGKMITIVYKNAKGYEHAHTGEITASTKYNLLSYYPGLLIEYGK